MTDRRRGGASRRARRRSQTRWICEKENRGRPLPFVAIHMLSHGDTKRYFLLIHHTSVLSAGLKTRRCVTLSCDSALYVQVPFFVVSLMRHMLNALGDYLTQTEGLYHLM